MSSNLVSLIMQFITPDLLAKFASGLGIDRGTAQKAVGAGIPAILANLAGVASKPGGAQQLSGALEQMKPGVLDNFIGAIGSPAQVGHAEQGTDFLSSLLGSGRMNALTSAIASHSGISASKSETLLGLLGPLAIGALGQQQRKMGLDANGIGSLLTSQKDQIAAAMPASLSSYLQDSGLSDTLGSGIHRGADAVSAAGRGAANIGQDAIAASRQAAAAAPQMPTWPFWAAGLAVLAGLGWMLMADRDGARVAEETSRPVVRETVGSGRPNQAATELTGQLTRSFEGMKTTLQGITDPATAQAAMPKLQQMTADLDKLNTAKMQLPPEARSLVAGEIASLMPAFNQMCDRVLAIPGVSSVAQPLIDLMRTKLRTMSQA